MYDSPLFPVVSQELENPTKKAKEGSRQTARRKPGSWKGCKQRIKQAGREVERLNPQQGSTRGKESQDKRFDRALLCLSFMLSCSSPKPPGRPCVINPDMRLHSFILSGPSVCCNCAAC